MHWLFIILALTAPGVTEAAPRSFIELTDIVIELLNAGIGVSLSLAIVVYFYGITTSFKGGNKGNYESLRNHLTWGLIALFVMFSVWGILRLVSNTLFSGDRYIETSGDGVLCDSIDGCVILGE